MQFDLQSRISPKENFDSSNGGHVDVAIVGAGPTGLVLANLLGLEGIKVALIEQNDSTVDEPRAVSIDDESLRTIQATGLLEEVLKDISLDYGSRYMTAHGACFATVEPKTREYGFPRRNAFGQPALEKALRDGLDRFPSVTALFGQYCEGVIESTDLVVLQLRDARDAGRRITARYVVGCDGARSRIRKSIGANLQGETYQQRWLIVDLAATAERARYTRVSCNPDRPALTLPGPHGRRRYEFMLHDDESDESATSDAFIKNLLASHGPDSDAPISRRRVYSFHARIVDRWQTSRIFLAGDAAHLSPPFAGQGMNSGLRDAQNLGWKLAAVVQGFLGRNVLSSYEQERAPHALALIRLAVLMGRVMMPVSHLQAWIVRNVFRAARLFPPVYNYLAEMKYKPKPFYRSGFIATQDPCGLVGRMLPQPDIERADGVRIRLDDMIGNQFAVVVYGPDAQRIATRADRMNWGVLPVKAVAVLPSTYNMDRTMDGVATGRDVSGGLQALGPHGANRLIVLRPDRYVMAAADIIEDRDISELAVAMARLAAQTFHETDHLTQRSGACGVHSPAC